MIFRIPSDKLSIEVDDDKETVTIDGVPYSYDFFRYMNEPNPEQPVHVAKGENGLRFILSVK
jgi:hypothetical protein